MRGEATLHEASRPHGAPRRGAPGRPYKATLNGGVRPPN